LAGIEVSDFGTEKDVRRLENSIALDENPETAEAFLAEGTRHEATV
jgi:hypothetical protein